MCDEELCQREKSEFNPEQVTSAKKEKGGNMKSRKLKENCKLKNLKFKLLKRILEVYSETHKTVEYKDDI